MAAAIAWPATAAVPCPITWTVPIDPERRRLAISSEMVSSPRRTVSVTSDEASSASTSRPRSVLRNDVGDSEISFSRKWGESPRSMSRVVTDGFFHSSAAIGSSEPS